MNNRIKQLAVKSGLLEPHGSDTEGLRDFDYVMFGQLIAYECIDLALGSSMSSNDTAAEIADKIKANFGFTV